MSSYKENMIDELSDIHLQIERLIKYTNDYEIKEKIKYIRRSLFRIRKQIEETIADVDFEFGDEKI